MNRSYGSRNVRGLTTQSNKLALDKAFPDVYEIKSWGWSSDRGKLRILRKIAKEYGRDPRLREHTVNVIRQAGAQARDYRSMAQAILSYVQNNIYYVNEPGEQVQSPWYTIRKGFGDCDDMSVLMAAMAESIMLPWRFALAGKGFAGRNVKHYEGGPMAWGGSYSHIYVQLGWPPIKPTTWMSAEPTIKGVPLGYDVVDHGVPGTVPQARAGGRSAAGRGPSMPQARLSGYGGTIIGREGYGDAFGVTSGEEAAIAAQAALQAQQAAQAAKPVKSFWQKIDWSEIGAGVIQGVLVSATVALLAPSVVKGLQKR